MTTASVWRALILLATVFCVVMLFAPLVHEMLIRMAEVGGEGFP
jgi:hypothetical protein